MKDECMHPDECFELEVIDGINKCYPKPCYAKCRMELKLKFACVPEKYKEKRINDFKINYYKGDDQKLIEKAILCVNYYLSGKSNKTFYFCSKEKGSGKTMLMSILANELIEREKQVKFATAPDILSEIKNTWNKNGEYTENKLITDISNSCVLIIDDYGISEKPSAWENDKFYEIINSRYIKNMPTFFTSNSSINNLNVDSRIKSRIAEMCIEVKFPEISVRSIIGATKDITFDRELEEFKKELEKDNKNEEIKI
jgi:DNA replication protein DnaC